MRTTVCACFAIIVSTVSVARADPPKLVGETILMEVKLEFSGPWLIRLSRDGELLLLRRRVPVKQAASPQPGAESSHLKSTYQVLLRQLKTGKEKALPIPLLSGIGDILALSMNPFSADDKLLVVPAGIDEDGDGIVARGEKLEPAVFDIESGKLRRIGVQGDWIFATFDAAGKHLIFTVAEGRAGAGRTCIAPVDTLQPKTLKPYGLPLIPRPGDTTFAFGQLIASPDGAPVQLKLVLYDYLKDARAVGQPFHDRNMSPLPFVLQWTADGRYLYCTDELYGRDKRGLTQVWDMQESKRVARLPECLAIGPCGGPTTMVLSKYPQGPGGLLHDARTGSQEPLSGSTAIYPISTAGKYLLYDRKNERGSHVLCRAEIQTGQPVGRSESDPSNQEK